jgi:hypothetical protein
VASSRITQPGGTDGEVETLSTGQQVELPLATEATVTGVVLPADRDAVRDLLPEGLRPVHATPAHAAVTFQCVEYHRVGRRGEIEPYNEFGVLVPAVHGNARTIPYVSVFTRGLTGYVWYLPVTSEPAKALGVDIWGYPKEVGTIDHEDEGSTRHTSVTVDGQELIELSIERPPTISWSDTGVSYTYYDETLLREQLEFDGKMGVWPYSKRFSCQLGDHPRARRLRELGLGDRALLRFAADTEFCIHEGRPVEAR